MAFLIPLITAIGTSFVPAGVTAGLTAAAAGGLTYGSMVGAAGAGIVPAAASSFGLAELFSIGSTAASALSSMQAGQQQQDMANYNAKVLANQAMAADLAGQAEGSRIHDVNRRKIAQAQNAYGASGVDVSLGSPVDVMADLAAEGALDEQIARWRGKVNAQGYQNQAGAQRYAGDIAASTGMAKAGTTLLSGFGRVLAPSKYPATAGYS